MKDPVIRAVALSLIGGVLLLCLVAHLYVWSWPHG